MDGEKPATISHGAPSRFLIDVRVGPRTLELAKELVASVARSGMPDEWLLLLVDDHLPYPVHVGACKRLIWAEERDKLITSPLFDEEP